MTERSPGTRGARFATTRWSVVLAAGRESTAEGRAALQTLCCAAWLPLYAFARRGGAPPEEAADLVQGFFADLLARDGVRDADPDRGRFRTFLLAAFRHFASKERARDRAAKRGGAAHHVSFDFDDGESRYRAEPVDHRTPESVFERHWALALLDRVLDDLRRAYDGDRALLFDTLRPWLVAGGDPPSHAAAAELLGMGIPAVKVALHRLRRRYRDLLRAAIAETVAAPDDVDDEIRHLADALA